jgi:DNA-directed RNA polymerase, mitochondrial
VSLVHNTEALPVESARQKSAFPPNFVHSLDSTHMLLTAEKMDALGLPFAAVHDSYWAHAGAVDDMNTALREAFVELYSQPVLEDLHRGLQLRFPQIEFPPVPDRGALDLQKVRESAYFFN